MKNYLQHTQKFITAVDELDYKEDIKLSAIMQYFQDLATIHATEIGIGFEQMKQQNLLWILSRVSAVIDQYPAMGDEISVTTYPRKPNIVDAIRDYYITDKNGKTLIRGTSKWCVIDMNTHAIKRCAPIFSFTPDQYIPTMPFEDGNLRLPEIEEIGGYASVYKDKVKITDLDRNVHMNNARYGDIVLNSCDINFLNSHSVKAFDINFLSELKIGDCYEVLKADNEKYSYFEGKNPNNNSPIFRARVQWIEK